MSNPPEISVITTCFFEERSIDEFHDRLQQTLEKIGRSYEWIFVNDGSTDNTFARIKDIFERNDKVRVIIDLFRNSGQAAAIAAGIVEARGRYIVLMDSDLQLDPEELPELFKHLDAENDIVSGYRKNRKDPLSRTIPSRIANVIMRAASRSSLRDFGCTYKVFDGRLIGAFDYGPSRKFNQVDVIAQAQHIAEVPVTHHPRKYGTSGWTFRKLLAFNLDNIVRLSEKFFQLLALTCFVLSGVLICRVVVGFVLEFQVVQQVTNAL